MVTLVMLVTVLLGGCASTEQAPVLDRTTQPKPPPRVVAPIPEPAVVVKPVAKPAPSAGVVVTPLPSGDGAAMYMVKPGDTLFSIAKANGVSVRDLAAWNNIEDPSNISVGQPLRLTAPGGVTATPVKPPVGAVEGRAIAIDTPPVSDPNIKSQPLGQRVPYSEQAYAQMKSPGVKPEVKAEARTEVKLEPVPERKPPAKVEPPRADSDLGWSWPAEGKIIGNFNESSNKGITIAGKRGQPVHASAAGRVIYSGTGIRGLGKLVVIRHNRNYQSVYAHNDTLLVKEGQNVTKGQPIAEMGNSDADQVKLHFEIRHQGRPVDPIKLLPAT
jgi:lipoprotein NlpD